MSTEVKCLDLYLVHQTHLIQVSYYVSCDCKFDSKLCEIAKLQAIYHFKYVRDVKEFKVISSSNIFAG